MCRPPTDKIAMAVSTAIDEPHAMIRGLRPVHSSKLHRVYEVVLSDGRTLELVMPPSSMLRLLRLERQTINSEAIVVQWLSALLSDKGPVNPGSTSEGEEEDSSPDPTKKESSRSSRTSSQQDAFESGFKHDTSPGLLRLLPKLVNDSIAAADLGGPCSIYQPRGGTPIASRPRPLTKQQRAKIDFRLGRLTRQFAEITSPKGRFGHAVSVVAPNQPVIRAKDGSRPTSPSSGPMEGTRTWSATFHMMFEGVLRDAEDMAIMLAYSIIRKHLKRLSHALDEVTVPSLFFIDGMDDTNVLVASSPPKSSGIDDNRASRGGYNLDSADDSSDEGKKEDNPSAIDDADEPSPTNEPSIEIVGLRDWGNGVFGDPLLATAFSNDPSQELLDGFYDVTTGQRAPTPNNEEQRDSAKTRLLLYQAYHATVSIVTEFYRPRGESTSRELAGRRKLTEVLMKLENVEDDPKSIRHRRPSGEMSPAKKLKPDDTERPSPLRRHESSV